MGVPRGTTQRRCPLSEHSLPRTPRTDDPDERHKRLLEAARAALRWFEEFDEHAPSDFVFGGEAKIRRQLRRAIAGAER
jgi:hypothetical protein